MYASNYNKKKKEPMSFIKKKNEFNKKNKNGNKQQNKIMNQILDQDKVRQGE